MQNEDEKINFNDLFSIIKNKERKWKLISKKTLYFTINSNVIDNSISTIRERDYFSFLKEKIKEKSEINKIGMWFNLLSLIELLIAISITYMLFNHFDIVSFNIVIGAIFLICTRTLKLELRKVFDSKVHNLKNSIDYFFKKYGGARRGDIECYDYGLKVKTKNNMVNSFEDWIKVDNRFKYLS